MSVNMDALEDFVSLSQPLTAWAQHADFISMLMEGVCLFPNASIERDRKVLDNNQDLSLRHSNVKSHTTELGIVQPPPPAPSTVPQYKREFISIDLLSLSSPGRQRRNCSRISEVAPDIRVILPRHPYKIHQKLIVA